MTKLLSKYSVLIWFILAWVSFFVMDEFAISVGDDLGYLFTDKKLHDCSGELITNFGQCIETQIHHYQTTNGRFIVHVITSALLALMQPTAIHALNALMFAVLMVLVGVNMPRENRSYALTFAFLWLLLPRPGTVMLSLVAFAVNYLWSAVAYLIFIMIYQRGEKQEYRYWQLALMFCVALFIGSLHESYGLPIAGALVIIGLARYKNLKRIELTLLIGFCIGVAVSVFAPGNLMHLSQGGGIAVNSVGHKMKVLVDDLIETPMSWLFCTTIIFSIFSAHKAMVFIKNHALYYLIVMLSLLLACLTYTSIRQLYCPSVFSIIILLNMIVECKNEILKRVAIITSLVLSVLMLALAYPLRQNTYNQFCSFLSNVNLIAQKQGSVVTFDSQYCNYNHLHWYNSFVAHRFDADPLECRDLRIVGDSYTKQGLSRMFWTDHKSNHFKTFINTNSTILKKVDKQSPKPVSEKSATMKTCKIDERYVAYIVPEGDSYYRRPFANSDCTEKIPFETFTSHGVTYIIACTSQKLIYLKQKKPAQNLQKRK